MVTNSIMLLSLIIIGGIGTQPASKYAVVVFSFVVITTYNFGIGQLAYTVAREMAVGLNQNKIMSASIVVFYITTWAISFTAPYLYYDAGLGPMLGFVYAATTFLTIIWTWYCVGETSGRTSEHISLFFTEKIPVRAWRTHVFPASSEDGMDSAKESKAKFEHEEFQV